MAASLTCLVLSLCVGLALAGNISRTQDYDVAVFYRMLTGRIPYVPTPPVAVRFY